MTAATRYPLARPPAGSTSTRSPRVAGAAPRPGPPVRRPRPARRAHATRPGGCGSPRRSCAAMARIQRLRAGFASTTPPSAWSLDLLDRIARARGGAAAHVPTHGGAAMDLNRLTQKSQEALHDAQTKALRFGHTEVDGEHLLLALLDQPDGLVPRLLGAGRRRPGRAARRPGGRARPPARGSAAPARRPARSFVTQRLSPPARRRRAGGRPAQGRVRLGRAPAARAARRGLGTRGRAGCCTQHGLTRDGVPAGADRRSAATSGSRRRCRRPPTRRWRSTAATWSPTRASRPARPGHRPRRRDPPGRSRSCPARRRTTRC